jgi:hypothetical protein
LPLPREWECSAKWLTWTYSAKHLPPAFHQSHEEFELFVKWLRSSPHRSSTLDPHGQSAIVLMCLGIGLVLRDLRTGQFELGEDSSDEHLDASVKHLKKSKLGWAQSQVMVRCCQDLRKDIRLCFNEEEEEGETLPLPRSKSTAPKSCCQASPPKQTPSNQCVTRKSAAATNL